MKRILFALAFVLGLSFGCDQKLACPNGWDARVQGCVGMPPLPPMAAEPMSDAGPDGDADAHG